MAAPDFEAENISASWANGSILSPYKQAAVCEVGSAVTLNADEELVLADANSATLVRFVGLVVNTQSLYGETSVPIGDTVSVCQFGPVYGFEGLVPGTLYYVSDTPGELTDTPPTGGAYQSAVAHAIAEDALFINPTYAVPDSV